MFRLAVTCADSIHTHTAWQDEAKLLGMLRSTGLDEHEIPIQVIDDTRVPCKTVRVGGSLLTNHCYPTRHVGQPRDDIRLPQPRHGDSAYQAENRQHDQQLQQREGAFLLRAARIP